MDPQNTSKIPFCQMPQPQAEHQKPPQSADQESYRQIEKFVEGEENNSYYKAATT